MIRAGSRRARARTAVLTAKVGGDVESRRAQIDAALAARANGVRVLP